MRLKTLDKTPVRIRKFTDHGPNTGFYYMIVNVTYQSPMFYIPKSQSLLKKIFVKTSKARCRQYEKIL